MIEFCHARFRLICQRRLAKSVRNTELTVTLQAMLEIARLSGDLLTGLGKQDLKLAAH